MKHINKDKFILTDVDDVLLDFMSGLEAFLKNEKNLFIDPSRRGNYHLTDVLNISREEEVKIYTDYAHSEYFTCIPAKRVCCAEFEGTLGRRMGLYCYYSLPYRYA